MSAIQTCQFCGASFPVEEEDLAFYKKIEVPLPTWCPECRMRRRMVFRNERSLYKDECDMCGEGMVSVYAPEKPFTVYCRECWFSDKWDALAYGREFDPDIPFFEQFALLMKEVPRFPLYKIRQNVACDYANFIGDDKNVYLSYSVARCENIFYSKSVDDSKDCFDCFNTNHSELCYENIDCTGNYSCRYMLKSRDCIDSLFLFDCVGCQNCFMCSNVKNKRFMIRNRQYTKEDYEIMMKKVLTGNRDEFRELREEFSDLREHALHKYGHIIKAEHSSGDSIENAKNARFVFDGYNVENVKYAYRTFDTKDVYDCTGAAEGELIYETVSSGFGTYDLKFGNLVDNIRGGALVDLCVGCSAVFGCVALRNKTNCILNKQYKDTEFSELREKVVKQMETLPYRDKQGIEYRYGEYFPPELSPFAYNETLAQEYFPISGQDAVQKGFAWRKPDASPYEPTIEGNDVPLSIGEVGDDILDEVIECRHGQTCFHQCTRAFRIAPAELEFYRRMKLPLPELCPNCRHYGRLAMKNPLKLWKRSCMCLGTGSGGRQYTNLSPHPDHGNDSCSKEFETSYAPDRPEVIYCETCYQAEVS